MTADLIARAIFVLIFLAALGLAGFCARQAWTDWQAARPPTPKDTPS